jgi:hypothetical protein
MKKGEQDMNTKFSKRIMVSLVTGLLLSLSAPTFADNSASGDGAPAGASQGPGKKHHHWKKMKKVFEACAQANGITLPAKGSGEKLSSADRTTVQACVKEFRESVRSCVQSAGISKPQPGQKPSAADKAAFKQCGEQAFSQIAKK